MDELADYPRVQALLRGLMHLTVEDEQLPLPVLLNVYRSLLRRPFEIAAVMSGGNAEHWNLVQTKRWPLLHEDMFLNQPMLGHIYGIAHDDIISLDEGAPEGLTDEMRELIMHADNDWRTYDPAITLHQLTWPSKDRLAICALLEAQLVIQEQILQMLLELAEDKIKQLV